MASREPARPGVGGARPHLTRKAAGELGERIEARIAQLEAAGLLGDALDPFDLPTVSTYNAFANGIFRDNALRVGRESESQVLGDASAWQLARSSSSSSRDERLAGLARASTRSPRPSCD